MSSNQFSNEHGFHCGRFGAVSSGFQSVDVIDPAKVREKLSLSPLLSLSYLAEHDTLKLIRIRVWSLILSPSSDGGQIQAGEQAEALGLGGQAEWLSALSEDGAAGIYLVAQFN